MANSFFKFKQFTIHQDRCAMKVTTDGCLFGALVAEKIKNQKLNNCLDIGTGTGLLSLMLAQKNGCHIDAIEIDSNAAAQAKENIADSLFAEKIQVIHGDATEFQFEKMYDLIIANPPFYENELKGTDSKKNIAHHNEGLLLSDLLGIFKKNLKPESGFFLLLPYKRNNEIKKLLIENELSLLALTFVRQTNAHDYFRIIISGKNLKVLNSETAIEELAIKDEKGNYTPAFTALLKDYYLNL